METERRSQGGRGGGGMSSQEESTHSSYGTREGNSSRREHRKEGSQEEHIHSQRRRVEGVENKNDVAGRGQRNDTNSRGGDPPRRSNRPPMRNEDVIAGLSHQRLCHEKPDIENLTNSIMQLYYNLEVKNSDIEANQEILDRIALAAVRVKAKAETLIHNSNWRFCSAFQQSMHMVTKRKTLKKNVKRIECNYLGMCRRGFNTKSIQELYERLNKVLVKIPTVEQLDSRSEQLQQRREVLLEDIENIRGQIEAKKSQLETICRIVNEGGSS